MDSIKEEDTSTPLTISYNDIEKVSPEKSTTRKTLRFERRQSSAYNKDGADHIRPASTDIEKDLQHINVDKISTWRLGMRQSLTPRLQVPGSVLLYDKSKHERLVSHPSILSDKETFLRSINDEQITAPYSQAAPTKRRKSWEKNIFLIPQPEISLNDPLNWSIWRKCGLLFSICIMSFLAGMMTTIFAVDLGGFISALSPLKHGLLTAIFMLGLAIGSIIVGPLSLMYGKRITYICATLILSLTSLWCSFSQNYTSLVFARLFMGIFVSPAILLGPSVIRDICHIHQRGLRTGAFLFSFFTGIMVNPAITFKIVGERGWPWTFHVITLLTTFNLLVLLLCFYQSHWDRSAHIVGPSLQNKIINRKHSIRSFVSYFSHHKPSFASPAEPHPGKAITYEHYSPTTNAQAYRREVLKRVNDHDQQNMTTTEANLKVLMASPEHPPSVPSVRFLSPDKASLTSPPSGSEQLSSHFLLPQKADSIQMTSPALSMTQTLSSFETPSGPLAILRSALKSATMAKSISDIPSQSIPAPQQVSPLSIDSWPTMRPTLRLDLDSIAFDRASIGGFTQDDLASGYQNGTYTRGLPSARSVGTGLAPATAHFPNSGLPYDFPHTCSQSLSQSDKNVTYTSHWRMSNKKSFIDFLRVWSGQVDKNAKFNKVLTKTIHLTTNCPHIVITLIIFSWSLATLIILPRITIYALSGIGESYTITTLPKHQDANVLCTLLIGTTLGSVVLGWISDMIITSLSRRNPTGIYESEFRLLPILIAIPASIIGFFGAACVIKDNVSVSALVVLLNFIAFACATGITGSLTYLIDTTSTMVTEAMVITMTIFGCVPALILTLTLDKWLEKSGLHVVLIVLGVINLLILLMSIPQYIFGKSARIRSLRSR